MLIALVAMMGAVPQSADARRKSTARTSQSSTKSSKSKSSKSKSSKSSSKSKKSKSKSSKSFTSSSSKSTASSSSKSTTSSSSKTATARTRRASTQSTASTQPITTDVRRQQTQQQSKRKIKVEKPDLDEVKRITLDPKSQFYFPKLYAKYERKDTTMTPEEYRNFYLGYMFQEDFDPYRVSPYSNRTEDLRRKSEHTQQERDTIEKYAKLSLQDNPFDLRQMSFLIHVYKEGRKDMLAKIWEYRLENILAAIKSTGTGADVENAWFVMYPSHEYDMLQLLGYEATDYEFIEPGYDHLFAQPDETDTRKRDKSAKGFYFNVMVPQAQYQLKHPEEN